MLRVCLAIVCFLAPLSGVSRQPPITDGAVQSTGPDPCTLVTSAQATQLLGITVSRSPASGKTTCIYSGGGRSTLWVTVKTQRTAPTAVQVKADVQGHARGVPVAPVNDVGDRAAGFSDDSSFGLGFSKGTWEVLVWAYSTPGSKLDLGHLTSVCRAAAKQL